jgi:hypothetical protein
VRQRQHKSFPIDNANVVGRVARLGFGLGLAPGTVVQRGCIVRGW